MGHRKHSAPRRGSLAFIPRGRYRHPVPQFRYWGSLRGDKPQLLGHAGFKVGSLSAVTVDDREKTPNFGKPFFNAATIVSTPPIRVLGLRAYRKGINGLVGLMESYGVNLPEEFDSIPKPKIEPQAAIDSLKKRQGEIDRLVAICGVVPRTAGLEQKTPFVFEVEVGGGKTDAQLDYLRSVLGGEVKFSDVFKPGTYVDIAGISRGKGFQGPIKRFGVRRKQAKSRKSVRAVAVLGPWHPAAVMYTVPRAGQMGLHKRVEYNKRILAVSNTSENPISAKGGFLHYGLVRGDYVIVKGSVIGPPKRIVRFRTPVRPPALKAQPPRILQTSLQSARV